MIATEIVLQYTSEGVPQLVATLSAKDNLKARAFMDKYNEARDKFPNKWYDIQIDEWHDKRSSGANGYMWALCDKIADKMHLQQTEVYRDHIREYGHFTDVAITPQAVPFLRESWRAKGFGWFTEYIDKEPNSDGLVVLRLFFGSSSYNSKEMSRLIDGVVQTAQAIGIETKTPDQIASMISLIREGVGE